MPQEPKDTNTTRISTADLKSRKSRRGSRKNPASYENGNHAVPSHHEYGRGDKKAPLARSEVSGGAARAIFLAVQSD